MQPSNKSLTENRKGLRGPKLHWCNHLTAKNTMCSMKYVMFIQHSHIPFPLQMEGGGLRGGLHHLVWYRLRRVEFSLLKSIKQRRACRIGHGGSGPLVLPGIPLHRNESLWCSVHIHAHWGKTQQEKH